MSATTITESAIESNGAGPADADADVDSELVKLVEAEMGLKGPRAVVAAIALSVRVREEQQRRLARQVVADRSAARDQRLDSAHIATADMFLEETDTPAIPLLGELASEGHNITVTAAYKTGKTTLIGNAAAALVTGGTFLGRFPVGEPRRVALLNYELTARDQRSMIRDLQLPTEAAQRLLVLNLRGVRLSLTTPTGRDYVIKHLADHRAQVVIFDTYGAAAAPSVESENDNAGARRFLATIDEIKLVSRCESSIWTAHTGRRVHEEGSEHARGATVLDDWADVRLVLTKDRGTGIRFLYSEGRGSYDLPESPLRYDRATRGLSIVDSEVGSSRRDRRVASAAEIVSEAVVASPGQLSLTDLREALENAGIASNADKSAGVNQAKRKGLIHAHQEGHKKLHWPGEIHADETKCPAGWKPKPKPKPKPKAAEDA